MYDICTKGLASAQAAIGGSPYELVFKQSKPESIWKIGYDRHHYPSKVKVFDRHGRENKNVRVVWSTTHIEIHHSYATTGEVRISYLEN